MGQIFQVSSLPTITSTGKDLASYSYFESTIQNVAGLFVQIDPRTEESLKVGCFIYSLKFAHILISFIEFLSI